MALSLSPWSDFTTWMTISAMLLFAFSIWIIFFWSALMSMMQSPKLKSFQFKRNQEDDRKHVQKSHDEKTHRSLVVSVVLSARNEQELPCWIPSPCSFRRCWGFIKCLVCLPPLIKKGIPLCFRLNSKAPPEFIELIYSMIPDLFIVLIFSLTLCLSYPLCDKSWNNRCINGTWRSTRQYVKDVFPFLPLSPSIWCIFLSNALSITVS